MADNDLLEPRSSAEGHKEPEGTGAATSASLPWPLLARQSGLQMEGETWWAFSERCNYLLCLQVKAKDYLVAFDAASPPGPSYAYVFPLEGVLGQREYLLMEFIQSQCLRCTPGL